MAFQTGNGLITESTSENGYEENTIRRTGMVAEQKVAPEAEIKIAQLKVVGVGGGGSNAVSRMYRERLEDVEYITVNTDAQALVRSDVPSKIRIGDAIAAGLGVGGDPDKGLACAEGSKDELRDVPAGPDMVFLAARRGCGPRPAGGVLLTRPSRHGCECRWRIPEPRGRSCDAAHGPLRCPPCPRNASTRTPSRISCARPARHY